MSENTVPKYGLHKPLGQARVVLNGRTHCLAKYGTEESHRKYERLTSLWIANTRQLPRESGSLPDLTVNELLLAYLLFVEGYYVKNGSPAASFVVSSWQRDRFRSFTACFLPANSAPSN